jgi:hypothetical protein
MVILNRAIALTDEKLIRSAAEQIASVLAPAAYTDESFWKKHWPTLREITSVKAILIERISFFQVTPSRSNGVLLTLFIDLGWQLARNLGDVRGSSLAWGKKSWLADSAEASQALEFLDWAYDLHTALRHPATGWDQYFWLLANPWPEVESGRLLCAGTIVRRIMSFIDAKYNPESGFEGDVVAKRALAAMAAEYWNVQKAAKLF